jgi:signal transduction histidine kinase
VTEPIRTLANVADRAADAGESLAEEIARLELLRQLSIGAAHTLNNAFTAILGETLCLLDERKSDPLVAEACALIQGEVERCARLTRSVALRVQRREGVLDATDAASLLRSVELLLRETVSRSVAIACEVTGEGLLARGATEELEPLVLLCAHRLVGGIARGAQLRLSAERDESGDVAISLDLRAGADELARAESSWEEIVGAAAASLAARLGARLVDVPAPGARIVRLYFPPAAP